MPERVEDQEGYIGQVIATELVKETFSDIQEGETWTVEVSVKRDGEWQKKIMGSTSLQTGGRIIARIHTEDPDAD